LIIKGCSILNYRYQMLRTLAHKINKPANNGQIR